MNLIHRAIWSQRKFRSLDISPSAKVGVLAARNPAGCSLAIGQNSIVAARLAFERQGAVIHIGQRTYIGKSTLISANQINIGNDVLISWDVTIVDHSSHSIDFQQRRNDVLAWGGGMKDWSAVDIEHVAVGDKAWIGFGAVILKGVTIGEGAVVGAKSVVTRDVAPWTVVAGNPARTIRELTPVV